MANYNLFTETPALAADTDEASTNLGTEFYVTAACWVTHIRYRQPSTGTQDLTPRQAGIYSTVDGATGTLVAGPFTMPTPTAGTWVSYALPTPLALTTNTRYRVVVRHPGGRYGATGGYFTTGAGATDLVQGPVVRPNQLNATAAEQGSYFYSEALTFPTDYFGGGAYFSDVTITDVNPAGGPVISTAGTATAKAIATATASAVHTSAATATAQATATAVSSAITAATSTGTATARATADATTATVRTSVGNATAKAASTATSHTLRTTTATAQARASASATSKQAGAYRDIDITVGALTGATLAVTLTRNNPFTVGVPSGHPLTVTKE